MREEVSLDVIARSACDAEQMEVQADHAAGQDVAHGTTSCPKSGSADVTAAVTSDVIALPREAIQAAVTSDWGKI